MAENIFKDPQMMALNMFLLGLIAPVCVACRGVGCRCASVSNRCLPGPIATPAALAPSPPPLRPAPCFRIPVSGLAGESVREPQLRFRPIALCMTTDHGLRTYRKRLKPET